MYNAPMHMILGPAHRSQFLIRPFIFFINFNHFWSSVGYLSMDVLHVSLHILYMFVYFIFIENTMVHTKVTPRKTKEVQLIASCMLCSRDFSNV
jgi:hypothetical protein